MKKVFVFTILLLFSFLSSYSQTCLTNGILFNYQEQVDSFSINYSGCTEILGDVRISSQSSITNLNGLNQLQSINGEFKLQGSHGLTSLVGLENLISIGGDVIFVNNDMLINLEGLNNLATIGGELKIVDNAGITSLSGLENLSNVVADIRIQYNNSLPNLDGFQGLVTHVDDLKIEDNASLVNLVGLENLTGIVGNIFIQENAMLANLVGLDNLTNIGKGLVISGNSSLTSLNGLDDLTSISSLEIVSNDNLTNINELNSLTTLANNLAIISNDKLMNIDSLENLTYVGGLAIRLEDNIVLNDISGLRNVDMVDLSILSIYSNPMLSYCHYTSVCNHLLNGSTSSIGMNATGCNSKEEIEMLCLTSTSELDNIKIQIYPNPVSTNVFIKKEKTETLEYQITDVNGRLLMSGKLINEIHNITFTKMNSGVYFIKIINPVTREYIVEKIVK